MFLYVVEIGQLWITNVAVDLSIFYDLKVFKFSQNVNNLRGDAVIFFPSECQLLTLTVKHTLHHFFQAHHVDELAVGSRGQEVEKWGRGFGWRDLQQGFLQLLPQGQLGCCLAAGLVGHGAHPSAG